MLSWEVAKAPLFSAYAQSSAPQQAGAAAQADFGKSYRQGTALGESIFLVLVAALSAGVLYLMTIVGFPFNLVCGGPLFLLLAVTFYHYFRKFSSGKLSYSIREGAFSLNGDLLQVGSIRFVAMEEKGGETGDSQEARSAINSLMFPSFTEGRRPALVDFHYLAFNFVPKHKADDIIDAKEASPEFLAAMFRRFPGYPVALLVCEREMHGVIIPPEKLQEFESLMSRMFGGRFAKLGIFPPEEGQ